jgi:hypothetical protein
MIDKTKVLSYGLDKLEMGLIWANMLYFSACDDDDIGRYG